MIYTSKKFRSRAVPRPDCHPLSILPPPLLHRASFHHSPLWPPSLAASRHFAGRCGADDGRAQAASLHGSLHRVGFARENFHNVTVSFRQKKSRRAIVRLQPLAKSTTSLRAGSVFELATRPFHFYAWIPCADAGDPCGDRFGVRLLRWRLLAVVDARWEFCPAFEIVASPPGQSCSRAIAAFIGRVMHEIARPQLWRLDQRAWKSPTLRRALHLCSQPSLPLPRAKVKSAAQRFSDRLQTPAALIPGFVGSAGLRAKTFSALARACQAGHTDPAPPFPPASVRHRARHQLRPVHQYGARHLSRRLGLLDSLGTLRPPAKRIAARPSPSFATHSLRPRTTPLDRARWHRGRHRDCLWPAISHYLPLRITPQICRTQNSRCLRSPRGTSHRHPYVAAGRARSSSRPHHRPQYSCHRITSPVRQPPRPRHISFALASGIITTCKILSFHQNRNQT